jgi:hypothetical protein
MKVIDTTEWRNLFSGGATLPLHPRGDGKQTLERTFIPGLWHLAMTVLYNYIHILTNDIFL